MIDFSGRTIEGYLLEKRAGSGASSDVYVATKDRERFAFKIYKPEVFQTGSTEAEARIKREVELGRRVTSTYVARTFAWGRFKEGDTRYRYLVLEFLEGKNLERAIRDHGPFELDTFRAVARRLVEAVAAVHEAGMIHRDIKPANVMLPDDQNGPRPVLVDFGVINDLRGKALTSAGKFFGTFNYAAPEYLEGLDGAANSPAIDVYSLGATFFEMLTGKRLFGDTENRVALADRVRSEPPSVVAAGIPAHLLDLVRFMLAKDPALRPSLSEVQATLDRVVEPTGAAILEVDEADAFFQQLQLDERRRQRLLAEKQALTGGLIAVESSRRFQELVRPALDGHRISHIPAVQVRFPVDRDQHIEGANRTLGRRFLGREWFTGWGILIPRTEEYIGAALFYYVDGLPDKPRVIRAFIRAEKPLDSEALDATELPVVSAGQLADMTAADAAGQLDQLFAWYAKVNRPSTSG